MSRNRAESTPLRNPCEASPEPVCWKSSRTTLVTHTEPFTPCDWAHRIYVLHAFQKKSKHGLATPKAEIELIKVRLKRAEQEHAAWLQRRKEGNEHGQNYPS